MTGLNTLCALSAHQVYQLIRCFKGAPLVDFRGPRRSLVQSIIFTPLLYQDIFLHVGLLKRVEIHLRVVKTLVLKSNLRDISCF